MKDDPPSPSESNGKGRGPNGRFAPGNQLARGNPYAAHVQKLRTAMLEAVTPEAMRSIILALVAKAEGGDVAAAREIFERCLGRPLEHDILEKIAELEGAVRGRRMNLNARLSRLERFTAATQCPCKANPTFRAVFDGDPGSENLVRFCPVCGDPKVFVVTFDDQAYAPNPEDS